MTMVAAAVLPDAGDTTDRIETGATMTASFAQLRPARTGPTPAAAVTAAVVGGISVLTLILVGTTFFALAVAFPIAVPIAEAYNLPVSATDIALAARFAELSWAFAALAFASFASALVVIVKVISFLSPAPRD
jgi:hypothetical protein